MVLAHVSVGDPHVAAHNAERDAINGFVSGGGAVIDDSTPALDTVYSSSKSEDLVAAAITALVNASPSTLNTLKEIADALGDDPNYAATITAALATKITGSGGLVPLSAMESGGIFVVTKVSTNWKYAGATITARPSSRTDLFMFSVSTDGTVPSFAQADHDIALTVPS